MTKAHVQTPLPDGWECPASRLPVIWPVTDLGRQPPLAAAPSATCLGRVLPIRAIGFKALLRAILT
jgi:hypothetical protein